MDTTLIRWLFLIVVGVYLFKEAFTAMGVDKKKINDYVKRYKEWKRDRENSLKNQDGKDPK